MSHVEKLARDVRGALILVAVMTLIWIFFPIAKDSTDPINGRSGLQLLTDAKTGCQYLARRGGLTPRLDVSGKQVGCH